MTSVLLTNDDGYEAPGFQCLVQAVKALGFEPLIAAPLRAMSGASRSRSANERYEWKEILVDGVSGFAIDGTPAACVVFGATAGFFDEIDFCLSGVNAGENLGAELTVSGTFGAALEAHSHGIRSLAISRQYGGPIGSDPTTWDWSLTLPQTISALEWCFLHEDWQIANVNIPNRPSASAPVQTTVSSQSYFANEYQRATHTINSWIDTDRRKLMTTDDIYGFESLGRVSVTFLDGSGL